MIGGWSGPLGGGDPDAASELFAVTGPPRGGRLTGSRAGGRWPTTSPRTRSSARSPRSSRFDERRPFAPWLHRIVVNRALDLLRAERRLVGTEPPSSRPTPALFDAEGDRALLEAVAGLPLQRRVVVVLRYGIGMGPDEIAKVLDLPSGTVHSRLARALEQLRDQFEVSDVQRA